MRGISGGGKAQCHKSDAQQTLTKPELVEGETSLPLLPSVPTPPSPDAENQDGFLQKIAKGAKSPWAERISKS